MNVCFLLRTAYTFYDAIKAGVYLNSILIGTYRELYFTILSPDAHGGSVANIIKTVKEVYMEASLSK